MGGLDLLRLSDPVAVRAHVSPTMIALTALLIFGGIIGKSAQFPLMTWLPDAMEGPTPVSALLHSATMVAAGVYLFSRLFAFFSLSSTVMTVCLAVGAVSMVLASTMALVARDIKQIWAFSTISQLGYMLMGLGAGSLFAGFFHLMTHAAFKALLFLTAGVLIHHYNTNDIFRIARLGGRRLKAATICMIIGAGALSGLPPLAGFFSKDLILGQLNGLENPIWFVIGMAGVFLTAYYSFRPVWIILFPRGSEEGNGSHAGAGERDGAGARVMSAVLWALALVTLTLGFFKAPIERFVAYTVGLIGDGAHPIAAHAAGGDASPAVIPHAWLPVVAGLLAVAAIALAWLEYGRARATQKGFVERMPFLVRLFDHRWYHR